MNWYLLFLLQLLVLTVKSQQQRIIVTNADRTLIPEGIAIHNKTGSIYVSSINQHKIITFDKNGNSADFISSGKHGFLEGLGMKIDEQRNWIWALSNQKANGTYTSRIQAFDLKTAEEKVAHTITDTIQHLFNDLVIVDEMIYITDTYFSAVYKLDIRKDEFKLFKKHVHLTYPNGITADSKRAQLYIATYQNGIIRLDLKTQETDSLSGYRDAAVIKGLDGLVYYGNRLTGVYNIGEQAVQRVVQYRLHADGRSIIDERDVDKGNQRFHQPTTLAVYKSFIYVIANSHLAAYNRNKESTAGIEDQLSAPEIIRYKLGK